MVEHHLAKVRVAGSSPVIRSTPALVGSTVGWPRGEAAACKAVHTGSNPVPTSHAAWAIGAAVARFPDTEEVTGSIPVSPTSTARPSGRRRRRSEGLLRVWCARDDHELGNTLSLALRVVVSQGSLALAHLYRNLLGVQQVQGDAELGGVVGAGGPGGQQLGALGGDRREP